MKMLIATVTMLATVLILTAPAIAQQPGAAATQYDDGGPLVSGGETIQTYITEVGDWYIQVQHPDNTGESTAKIWVSGSAEILWSDGTQATQGDLRVEQYIELTFTGPLDECPPDMACAAEIASAVKIIILDENRADPSETAVQGSIVNVLEGGIRVSENPSLGIDDPGFCETTYDFTITDGTGILRQQNGQLVQAGADDLRVGQSVEVTYSYPPDGAVAAICPVQLPADKIVILGGSPETPSKDPQPEPANPPDNGSNNRDTGKDSEDGPTLLPNTGGIPLPVAGATVLMIFGGLLARRLIR